jgi:hypothetical protein
MLYSEQLRAARALLRWEQSTVAAHARVSVETVKRLERLDGPIVAVKVGAARRQTENHGRQTSELQRDANQMQVSQPGRDCRKI